jgi:predicted ribosomally synthesized peptide with nif11-like leader
MSQDSVQKFIQAVNDSNELQTKCKGALDGAADPSGFVALAKENGFEFTESDALSFFGDVLGAEQPGELSDEDLANVAGGAGSKDMPSPTSKLGNTVRMFQGLKLNNSPRWSGFR